MHPLVNRNESRLPYSQWWTTHKCVCLVMLMWPWLWPHDLDLDAIKMHLLTKNEISRSQHWKTRSSAIAEEPRDALCQLKYYGRFLTELLTRSSANAQEPCEHTVSWNRLKCHTNDRRIACENVCKRWMTFRVIQGHCRCYHLIGHILFHISLPLKVYADLAPFSRY